MVDPDNPDEVINYPCGEDDPLTMHQEEELLEQQQKQKRMDIIVTFVIAIVIFLMTLAFIFLKPDFNIPQTKRFEIDDPLLLPPKSKPPPLPLSTTIGVSDESGVLGGFEGFESGIGSSSIGGNYSGFSGYSPDIGVSSLQ